MSYLRLSVISGELQIRTYYSSKFKETYNTVSWFLLVFSSDFGSFPLYALRMLRLCLYSIVFSKWEHQAFPQPLGLVLSMMSVWGCCQGAGLGGAQRVQPQGLQGNTIWEANIHVKALYIGEQECILTVHLFFINLGHYTKIPQTGWLKQKNLFLMLLEAGSPNSECECGMVLVVDKKVLSVILVNKDCCLLAHKQGWQPSPSHQGMQLP